MLSIQLLFPEDFFPYTAGSQAASHQNAVHIQLSDRPAQQTFVCRVSGRSEVESGCSSALWRTDSRDLWKPLLTQISVLRLFGTHSATE